MLTQGIWDILVGGASGVTIAIEVKNSPRLNAALAQAIVRNAEANEGNDSGLQFVAVLSQSKLFLWNRAVDARCDRPPDETLDMTPVIAEFAPSMLQSRIPGQTLVTIIANWFTALQTDREPPNLTERRLKEIGFSKLIKDAEAITWLTS